MATWRDFLSMCIIVLIMP